MAWGHLLQSVCNFRPWASAFFFHVLTVNGHFIEVVHWRGRINGQRVHPDCAEKIQILSAHEICWQLFLYSGLIVQNVCQIRRIIKT